MSQQQSTQLSVPTVRPLAKVFLGQTAAGGIASAAVTPIMSILDMSIIRAQFDKTTLSQAVRATTSDVMSGAIKFGAPARIMGIVYGSTYLTANYTKTACEELGYDYKIPTAVATSIVNVAAIAWKDRAYARFFNRSAATFPVMSYGLFAIRDGLTITSSFVLKNIFCQRLERDHGFSHRTADLTASFAVPMSAQLLSTPVHIMSLDLYANPTSAFAVRLQLIARQYVSVCSGRVMRIIPAFGVGTFLNDLLKEKIGNGW